MARIRRHDSQIPRPISFLTPPHSHVKVLGLGSRLYFTGHSALSKCCRAEVPMLSGLSQVTRRGGRQQSFSRPVAKSRSTGTLRQLNPDFLSQLPVSQP